MVSIRMDRCISPRPMTRKESVVAESSTFRATSVSYTHLDVYKRQFLNHFFHMKIKIFFH